MATEKKNHRKMRRFALPDCRAYLGPKVFPFVKMPLRIIEASLSGIRLEAKSVALTVEDKNAIQSLMKDDRDNVLMLATPESRSPLVFRVKLMRAAYRKTSNSLVLGFSFVSAANPTWSAFTSLLKDYGVKPQKLKDAA